MAAGTTRSTSTTSPMPEARDLLMMTAVFVVVLLTALFVWFLVFVAFG